MNGFRFSLEGVLQVKYRLEELALAHLAESQGRLIDAQHALARLFEEKQAHLAQMSRGQSGALDVGGLILSQQYLGTLNERLAQQQKRIEDIELQVEQRRAAVVEAQRERKTLETIKEKQWHRFLKDLQHAEQIFSDEVAGNRHGRAGGDK